MEQNASKSQARKFITKVKNIVDRHKKNPDSQSEKTFYFNTYKDKNREYMYDKKFKKLDLIYHIQTLTANNYAEGPAKDDRPNRDKIWWVFGKSIDDETVYIKLSIDKNNNKVFCDSFHEDEYDLDFPFKNGWGRRG